jgi:hypothetical protein
MATKPATKPATKGTAVAVKQSSNIVSIREQLAAQAAAMADRTAPPTGIAIRVTQDKHFMLPDGTKTAGPLQLVIVDFTSKNAFYPGAYDPKNISPPACFAIGNNIKTMAPSAASPEKQADACGTCPMNQFGSAGDGKACKNSRLLAVLPPGADEDTPLWTLATSPTANKGYDAFVSEVARVFNTPPVGVVVTVGFDPNETYAKLVFTAPVPNPDIEACFARLPEATKLLATEPDVSGFDKPKAKPAAKGRR